MHRKQNIIRLLCMDIDGTLLNTRHQLSVENRTAVQDALHAGVSVCLLSARPPAAMTPIADQLGTEYTLACYNGGLLLYRGKVMQEARIDIPTSIQLVREAEHCGISLSVYCGWDWFVEQEDEWSRQEAAITHLSPTVCPLIHELESRNNGAHKFLCMGQPEQIERMAEGIESRRLPVQLVRSKNTYLEILPLTAEKGMALQSYCRMLRISTEQAMAIGDHDNDCAMLRAAGLGIAMGNASEAARQAADAMTLSNDENGVAMAIRNWILRQE